MNLSHRCLIIIIISFISNKGISQKKTEDQNLLWLRYQLKLSLNPDWQVTQEIEERTYWFPWRQHQFLTRTMLNYKLGKGWSAGAGFAYFEQSLPQNPSEKDHYSLTELRPQLEISYKQNLSEKFELSHRYWSEFRIMEQEDGKFKYTHNRSRYKLEIGYLPIKQIKLKAFEEIMFNIGSDITYNVFDQNRLGLGFQYMPFRNLGFELGYINWFQQRSSGDEFYNRNIIRFTILHSIDLKNKEKK